MQKNGMYEGNLWPRGQRQRWRLSEERFAELGYVVTYAAGNPREEMYDPTGHPRLYEDFAELAGRAIREQWNRKYEPDLAAYELGAVETADSDVRRVSRWGRAGDFDQVGVVRAEEIPEVRRSVLRFVARFGPPAELSLPGEAPWTYPVPLALLESLELHDAMGLSEKAKRGDVEAEAQLCGRLTQNLRGVNMAPRPGEPGAHEFDSLRALMWLQLFQAHFSVGDWATCEGCGRLFVQSRRDQRYHNTACRNAAGLRRTRSSEQAQHAQAESTGGEDDPQG